MTTNSRQGAEATPFEILPSQAAKAPRVQLVAAPPGKMLAYRYPKMWSPEQALVLELFQAQNMKRNNAVTRLRNLEAKGFTAAQILAGMTP